MSRDDVKFAMEQHNLRRRSVPPQKVEAFGQTIYVRRLTWAEHNRASRAAYGDDGIYDVALGLVAQLMLACTSEAGEPIFDQSPGDRDLILESDPAEINKLIIALAEVNGDTPEAHEAGKEGSPATGAGARSSASAASSDDSPPRSSEEFATE